MADVVTTVSNLDIQLLNAERAETTTFKLDNPKQNLTREQVSAAMQPALTKGWLLTSKGSVAMYLGDVTYNTSTKIRLDGEDFYVTPTALTLNRSADNQSASGSINVSGATIQGYNVKRQSYVSNGANISPEITNSGLTLFIRVTAPSLESKIPPAGNFTVELVIMGTIVSVPITVPES